MSKLGLNRLREISNFLLRLARFRVRCRRCGGWFWTQFAAADLKKSDTMRTLLFLLPVVLVGCSSFGSRPVTQREILKQSQVEIARREPWASDAAIFVENPGELSRMIWKVRAGAFDYSDYPHYKGIYFVPGTERELRFTRDGCLMSYADRGNRCRTAVTTAQAEMLMVPEK